MDDESWDKTLYEDFIEMGIAINHSGHQRLIERYNSFIQEIERYRQQNGFAFRSRKNKKNKISAKRTMKKSRTMKK